jgi:hypothetical protein
MKLKKSADTAWTIYPRKGSVRARVVKPILTTGAQVTVSGIPVEIVKTIHSPSNDTYMGIAPMNGVPSTSVPATTMKSWNKKING